MIYGDSLKQTLIKLSLKVNNEAQFMLYPYIVRIDCFIIHFTLIRALNFNLEMFCTMSVFVSLSFAGVIKLI